MTYYKGKSPWIEHHRPHDYRKYSIAEHAYGVATAIKSFKWSHGRPPVYVFADNSMWTKDMLDSNVTPSPIDFYIAAFDEVFLGYRNLDYKTTFVKSIKDRRTSCPLTKELFETVDGIPNSFYWDKYNEPYEELIPLQQHDDKNPEVYDTKLEDHVADDTVYFVMGVRGSSPTSVEVPKRKSGIGTSALRQAMNKLMRSPSLC